MGHYASEMCLTPEQEKAYREHMREYEKQRAAEERQQEADAANAILALLSDGERHTLRSVFDALMPTHRRVSIARASLTLMHYGQLRETSDREWYIPAARPA